MALEKDICCCRRKIAAEHQGDEAADGSSDDDSWLVNDLEDSTHGTVTAALPTKQF